MIPARLQYGPFDGATGEVHKPPPTMLDVCSCWGCGCGHAIHYRFGSIDEWTPTGYHRYELLGTDGDGAIYRHAGTLDPFARGAHAQGVSA
jgi:hypothetical protein